MSFANTCASGGRGFESEGYRYGFNGKEKDGGIAEGSYDFGARIYNSQIGRWMSVDPYIHELPHLSPYNYAGNSPIAFEDKDGKFANLVIKYGVDVGINIATQLIMAYAFDDDVSSISEAWDKVSVWQALGEGVVDQLGGTKLRMAGNAAMQIFTYIDQVGLDNANIEDALTAGGIGLLEPILGDAIAKYGTKAVSKGLKKLGLSDNQLRKLNMPTGKAEAEQQAFQARTKGSKTQYNKHKKTSVAYDTKTGQSYTAQSGKPHPSNIEESMQKNSPNPSKELWDVCNCAEFKAVNEALNSNAKRSDLEVHTVDSKTGKPAERCKNCRKTTTGTLTTSDPP